LKKSPYLKRFRIFRNKSLVPDSIWNSPNFVVQQYLPEKIGKLHRIRQAYFPGNRIYGIDVKSQNPIVKSNNLTSSDPIQIPKGIIGFRNDIRLDYGKIDFTIHNGEIVILDVTKTIGFDDRSDVIEALYPGIDNPISYH
jgi:hypothetical protein